jgi:hypothetical protein
MENSMSFLPSRRIRCLPPLAGAAVLIFSLVLAPPASARPPSNDTDPGPVRYDRTDPVKTRCADSAVIVKEEKIPGGNGGSVGTLRLMYSTKCETNWIAVYNTLSNTMVNKSIARFKRVDTNGTILDDGGGSPEADPVVGWSYSKQVWAAGETCVDYSVWIKQRGVGVNKWPGALSGSAC